MIYSPTKLYTKPYTKPYIYSLTPKRFDIFNNVFSAVGECQVRESGGRSEALCDGLSHGHGDCHDLETPRVPEEHPKNILNPEEFQFRMILNAFANGSFGDKKSLTARS